MGDKTHRFVCRLQIHVTPTDDALWAERHRRCTGGRGLVQEPNLAALRTRPPITLSYSSMSGRTVYDHSDRTWTSVSLCHQARRTPVAMHKCSQCRCSISVCLPVNCPSALWHCWWSHLTCKIVFYMSYNVSSGTLNPNIVVAYLYLSVISISVARCETYQ